MLLIRCALEFIAANCLLILYRGVVGRPASLYEVLSVVVLVGLIDFMVYGRFLKR